LGFCLKFEFERVMAEDAAAVIGMLVASSLKMPEGFEEDIWRNFIG